MIDVRVGDKNFFEAQGFLRDDCEDTVDFPSGVDDRCLARVFAPYDGAILLERGNRKDCDFHNAGLSWQRGERNPKAPPLPMRPDAMLSPSLVGFHPSL
jgi:hypothetical protein